MDGKELVIAKQILEKLNVTRTNAIETLTRSEKIECLLLGPQERADESKEEATLEGLLNQILQGVAIVNSYVVKTMHTMAMLLRI